MKPSGNAWSGGLVFWAEYEKDYYLFLVNSNKNFRISHFINDQWIGGWQATDKDVINAGGGQVNRLKVILKKGSASAYINNHSVPEFIPSEKIRYRRIGFFVSYPRCTFTQ